jgi:hypothetical protein
VYKEEKLVKDTSKQLQWVTDTFVLKNPFVLNMLVNIVISNVCQSDKITFMYSRALGRVMAMDFIQGQVNYLVKTPVLKENVLYNDSIYGQMKSLVAGQLRSDLFQDLVKSQLTGLLQNEDMKAMGFRELAMVLRLDVVRSQFVKGIVDEKVYGTLSDKKLAEITDKSIYKFLK